MSEELFFYAKSVIGSAKEIQKEIDNITNTIRDSIKLRPGRPKREHRHHLEQRQKEMKQRQWLSRERKRTTAMCYLCGEYRAITRTGRFRKHLNYNEWPVKTCKQSGQEWRPHGRIA